MQSQVNTSDPLQLPQPLLSEPEKFTERQIRAARRQWVTLRHGMVRACGHKIDLSRQPRNNCEWCWEAWLKTSDGLLVVLHETLVNKGLAALKAQYGNKLVKMFKRFLDKELQQVDKIEPALYTESVEEITNEENTSQ